MPKADGKGTASVPEKTPAESVNVSPRTDVPGGEKKPAQLEGPNSARKK